MIVVVDVQIVVVQIVVVLEIVAGFDHVPYFDFEFVESKIIASVAVYDFVASVEDFASVYFAVYEIAKEVAGYEIEVTVAAYDFAE